MASPVKSNDESPLATTKEEAPVTEASTKEKTAANTTESDSLGDAKETSNIDKDVQSPLSVPSDATSDKGDGDELAGGDKKTEINDHSDTAGSESLPNSANNSTVGQGTSPASASASSASSATVSVTSPQTPTSAPRSKPLEKPKPLKLPDSPQQHHFYHSSQSQLVYHPGAAGFAALGGSHMVGPMPHTVFVGGAHLPQQGGGAVTGHMQSAHFGQHQPNLNHAMVGPGGDGIAAVSTDEILETMEQINRSVKAGQFSTTLAGHIFRLYSFLKHLGECLEQSHKNEINRVFVSLRQACCRDSGQLGTPCRLKIMELVELRAMGWRPNLAHSQYYLSRGDMMSGGDMEQLGAAPVSAPPFGSFHINPFGFNLPPTSLATGTVGPVASAADLVSTAAAAAVSMSTPQGPSYYLIPASHVGHTQAGIAFISPTAAATVMPPQPISPMAASTAAAAAVAHHQQRLHMPVTASMSNPIPTSNGINPSSSPSAQGPGNPFLKGAATKTSGKYSRPAKVPGKGQYRDEVIIRNSDSGKSKRRKFKVMGVKGRRVAVIEELSKTVISFQKVPQGAKERSLTITGPSEESIEQAKTLIEETIRRNVSPIRAEEDDLSTYRRASVLASRLDDESDNNSNEGRDETTEGVDDGKQHAVNSGGERRSNNELTLEAGQLGEMLKLQCSDPALLEAAKQALSAFFCGQKQAPAHTALRRTTTDAASRDQSKKERRKSMPMLDNQQRLLAMKQSSPPDANAVLPEASLEEATQGEEEGDDDSEEGGKSVTNKPSTLSMMIGPPIGKQKASSAARSTPNLAPTGGYNKRALAMMKSVGGSTETNGSTSSIAGSVEGGGDVETKFMADDSGGGTLVIHEKKSRVTVRVVYTREFVLQCAASPFAAFTPAGLPWMSRETPDILRPVPGKFDINGYKETCTELRQLQQ